jgi:hypothetical protein
MATGFFWKPVSREWGVRNGRTQGKQPNLRFAGAFGESRLLPKTIIAGELDFQARKKHNGVSEYRTAH